MKRRTLFSSLLLLGICVIAGLTARGLMHRHDRWAVYYGANLPYDIFRRYDILAFDSDIYPYFSGQKREKQVILGYLSTSEAEEYRSYYADIKKMDVLIAPSPIWDAHMTIDIRKPQWQEYFVHTLVPQVLAKGFDGIMLDTIDTPLYMEEQHPAVFGGMREAAIRLVKAVRAAHPDAKLMLNRGFPILDEVAGEVDYILAESIFVDHDLKAGTSRYFPAEVYDSYATALNRAKMRHPGLRVVSLDYWDMRPAARAEVRRIYATQRAHGFIPYVTTADLSQHHEEPL